MIKGLCMSQKILKDVSEFDIVSDEGWGPHTLLQHTLNK